MKWHGKDVSHKGENRTQLWQQAAEEKEKLELC